MRFMSNLPTSSEWSLSNVYLVIHESVHMFVYIVGALQLAAARKAATASLQSSGAHYLQPSMANQGVDA